MTTETTRVSCSVSGGMPRRLSQCAYGEHGIEVLPVGVPLEQLLDHHPPSRQ